MVFKMRPVALEWALPLSCCVTFGKVHSLSGSNFLSYTMGGNANIYILEWK